MALPAWTPRSQPPRRSGPTAASGRGWKRCSSCSRPSLSAPAVYRRPAIACSAVPGWSATLFLLRKSLLPARCLAQSRLGEHLDAFERPSSPKNIPPRSSRRVPHQVKPSGRGYQGLFAGHQLQITLATGIYDRSMPGIREVLPGTLVVA